MNKQLDWLPFNFHLYTLNQSVEHIISNCRIGRGGRVVTPNVHFLYLVEKEPDLINLFNSHDLILCDSMIFYKLMKFKKIYVPERVAGSDLLEEVIFQANEFALTVAIIGGTLQDCHAALRRINTEYPSIKVEYFASPVFSENPKIEELEALLGDIGSRKPNLIILSFGAPKQEVIGKYLGNFFINSWILNIGGGLSFFAKTKARSPKFLQKIGLEWFWRLVTEPMRLSQRYLMQDFPALFRLLYRMWS